MSGEDLLRLVAKQQREAAEEEEATKLLVAKAQEDYDKAVIYRDELASLLSAKYDGKIALRKHYNGTAAVVMDQWGKFTGTRFFIEIHLESGLAAGICPTLTWGFENHPDDFKIELWKKYIVSCLGFLSVQEKPQRRVDIIEDHGTSAEDFLPILEQRIFRNHQLGKVGGTTYWYR